MEAPSNKFIKVTYFVVLAIMLILSAGAAILAYRIGLDGRAHTENSLGLAFLSAGAIFLWPFYLIKSISMILPTLILIGWISGFAVVSFKSSVAWIKVVSCVLTTIGMAAYSLMGIICVGISF